MRSNFSLRYFWNLTPPEGPRRAKSAAVWLRAIRPEEEAVEIGNS